MNNKINQLFKVLIIIILATYGNLYISAKIKAETISTPIIKSITLEKNGQDLEPGDTTKIIVDIDLNRGPAIKKVALAIQRSDLTSSEDRHYVYPTLNLATGKYEATYVVPTQMYNGEYLLNYIHVENDAGKSTFKFDILGKFTVINGIETIYSTPIIKSVTLEKNGQDLEPGDTTKIIVDIDLNRGPAIKKVALAIQRSDLTSSEDRHYVYPTLNLATGKYEATYVVPTQMYNGEYLLNYIHVENDAGKSTFKFDILGKFTVINGLANPNTGSIDIIEPIVNPIVSGTTNVSGIAEALSTIKIFANEKEIGQGVVDAKGHFDIPIIAQDTGTLITVTSEDNYNNSKSQQLVVLPSALDYAHFEEKVVPKNHQFIIKLSNAVDTETISDKTIYVKNMYNQKVQVRLVPSEDGKSIYIQAPKEGYNVGQRYYIYVEKTLLSKSQKPLSKAIFMPFTIK